MLPNNVTFVEKRFTISRDLRIKSFKYTNSIKGPTFKSDILIEDFRNMIISASCEFMIVQFVL